MPTTEEIRALLRRLDGEPADAIESEEIECKPWEDDLEALHRTLREAVVCLANARGGAVIVGVRDGCRTRRAAITGVGRYDVYGLRRAMYDGTEPHILVDMEALVEPEGTLLVIHVPRGIPPHTTSDGVAKIRVGKECKPLAGRQLAELLARGGQTDPAAEIVPVLGRKELDPAEIAELKQILRRDPRTRPLAGKGDDEILRALGLVTDEGLTQAGLLLLGRTDVLLRHCPQHEVVFLRFKSTTRYDQREDLRGPLLSILRAMEHLVSIHNRVRTIQEKGFGQIELPDIAWEVAREAVLNAVTHRDYFVRQGVQVALHRDRLEVVSPGGFIGGITPANVLRHPPIHRNELLARTFQTLGYVNRVGLGVDRIYDALLRAGKGIPRYSADEAHVRLVIPLATNEAFALLVAEEERVGRSLDLDDLIVLHALTRVSEVDRWVAARWLLLPDDEAAQRLVHLREAGYLVVRGRGRGARYDFRRNLATKLREKAALDAEAIIEDEGVKLRILSLLGTRGRLTNAEIRRFSGFSRTQVYRIVRELVGEGKVRFAGSGRGAHIVPGGG